MNLDGVSAVVTGGASGLGRATAEALLEQGASVTLLDLASSPGSAVAAELGDRASFVAADVRDAAQVSAALDEAERHGPLRVVVSCAGIGDPTRVLGRGGAVDLERFARVVEINLVGTFNVIRLAAERIAATELVEGERGIVVNTASVAAYDGQIGQASYSASKGGLVAMTLPLARDLARSAIRVMTIAPGMFETPILNGLSDEIRASLAAQVPHPSRAGRPREYADLVVHIVQNQMLNGEVIRLDGAIRMAPR